MTRLSTDAYLEHIRLESSRFRDVLASIDPATPVPSCPEWTAADLLWHLSGVQDFWSHVVTHRPQAPQDYLEPVRPDTHPELLAAFDEASTSLQRALSSADPAEPAWSWSTEQSVGFTVRRQAHEALIHRLDAELAAGTVTALDPLLAADGTHEALEVMYGGTPAWGRITGAEAHVRVDSIDTHHQTWVQLGRFTGTDPDGRVYDEPDIQVVAEPASEPDVTVSGTAGDLDAWLWKRRDEEAITMVGDRTTYDAFLACISHPVN
ncbi:MAG TPA: maleylpyruvate isomerase family mycothiol-dependent enzyme [Nocardioides sp.]